MRAMLAKYLEAGNDPAKREKAQQELKDAWLTASDMEKSVHSWLRLTCHHNIPPAKLRDDDFESELVADKVAYEIFIHMMIEVTFIVKEKLAAEMEGRRGGILFDGWSRYARHFVALMALYLKRYKDGDKVVEKPVIRLLSCTTLPKDDSEGTYHCDCSCT